MKISLMNSLNQTVDLTADEKIYQVLSVDGLDPVKGQIYMDTIAGSDGSIFTGARVNNRNIVINLKINGDCDTNRQNLFTKFPVKEWVRVTVTTGKTAFIIGYVESISCNIFDINQTVQISILCPDPYFRGNTITISGVSIPGSNKEFSFSGTNPGDVEAFPVLYFAYQGTMTSLSISAYPNDASLEFTYSATDPDIQINTQNKTAFNAGETPTADMIPYMELGSVFPIVKKGNFAITATFIGSDFDNPNCFLSYNPRYGGM